MRDARGMNRFASVLKSDEDCEKSISQKSALKESEPEEVAPPESAAPAGSRLGADAVPGAPARRASDNVPEEVSSPDGADAGTIDGDEAKESDESEISAKAKTVQIESTEDDEKSVNELNGVNENITKAVRNNESDEVMEMTEERSPSINGVNDDNNGDELNGRANVDDNKRTPSPPKNKNTAAGEKVAHSNKRKISFAAVKDHSPPAKK